ncbi:hypothetical protein DPMN_113648 [Dreissena polymorpha]|uniref:Uncharacterized protein n=1 Tax=Dreissena polymorpha TaxID=45954 RepID=A0A9D4KHV7_DREPO|nr:hypothetical protein DPMN_113648 [Dreissena polymorpha]
MVVYISHSGLTRTPLHMMLDHAIYERDRSRSLRAALNKIGACSSYQTIRFSRSLCASYAVKCSEDGETPIPNTFTIEDYIMVGLDNSDYADKSSISGTECSHYAALVVCQDATVNRPLTKPPVSNIGISRAHSILKTKLPCQEVPPYLKPIVRPALSQDMLLHPEAKQATLLDTQTARNVATKREFTLSVLRNGSDIDNPHIWAAVHMLVSLLWCR